MNSRQFKFLEEVESAQLEPEQFGHEEHLRYAFLCLRLERLDRARTRVSATLRRLTRLWGERQKFHRTVTEALVTLVHQRVGGEESWLKARSLLVGLREDALGVLSLHYSSQRLWSEQARTGFLTPDLVGFDGFSTIGQLQKLSGLARSTILYYEKKGLLTCEQRSANGYRRYGEASRKALRRVRSFREAGLSISQIQELNRHPSLGPDCRESVLEARLEQIQVEMDVLRHQQNLLVELLGAKARNEPIDRYQWSALLLDAGLKEEGLARWHQLFEAQNPRAHREFLSFLGMAPDEAARVRRSSLASLISL